MVDLLLAIAHHLLAFTLVGALAVEFAVIRPGLERAQVSVAAAADAIYGMSALLIIIVGVGRVVFGLKGWEFYIATPAFWAKMAAFGVAGVLSIRPTIVILKWRKAGHAEAIPLKDIEKVRTALKAELFFLALVPICAAAMARGY
ncbi:DUF2214 family protein [Oryzicola mucosus]|uniref:DUF2214 family protein n=1 Tax=Oryzicola mucosus TaxID=2767425 RepID=A0A8J6PTH2_9HYPH|nr:DUF2214 family protein [Oryzicola mucosus]MBD0413147.1 DUF2214 family protein [Oryzicola mucosus]